MTDPTPQREVKVIMPPPVPGQPVTAKTQGVDPPVQSTVFDYIPPLEDLLKNKGIPGYYYLLVATEGVVVAQSEGWKATNVLGDVDTFTIQGPKGSCDVRLFCKGERLPCPDFQASKRPRYVDKNIKEITGLGLAEPTAQSAEEKQSVETESTNEPVGEPDLVEVEKAAQRRKRGEK